MVSLKNDFTDECCGKASVTESSFKISLTELVSKKHSSLRFDNSSRQSNITISF